jgi:DNA-binding MarR family transcriptional regulator/N-acetylglutamate synthase-like GNAT family acetyltransferase
MANNTRQKLDQRIVAVRSFNRFYTGEIGVITNRLLETPFSLPEARILFELAHNQNITATELAEIINLDSGYLSRQLASLENRKLIIRAKSKKDRRQRMLRLASKGKEAISILESRAKGQVNAMLKSLGEEDQIRLIKAMSAIKDILTPRDIELKPITIRTHRSGDIGWIVQRHGVLYNEEYRFDETFEALVANILGDVIKTYNHKKDHIWIAEIDGERAGTITHTAANKTTGQLRLFLVEPWARGRGIGNLLINESILFARQSGFKKVRLWTQSILHAARHLYEKSGFKLVKEDTHRSFGCDLVAQIWELKL